MHVFHKQYTRNLSYQIGLVKAFKEHDHAYISFDCLGFVLFVSAWRLPGYMVHLILFSAWRLRGYTTFIVCVA